MSEKNKNIMLSEDCLKKVAEEKNVRKYKCAMCGRENKTKLEKIGCCEYCGSLIYINFDKVDRVLFGNYPQNNQDEDEKIEWIVLKREENRLLLLSEYAIDCKKYNDRSEEITWEKCTLRKWLNNDFLNMAFSDEEKSMIDPVTVEAEYNHKFYEADPGNDTTDKVFLLSMNEFEEYLDNDIIKCAATEYSISKGVYVVSNNEYCFWWLRTPGKTLDKATCVSFDGRINAFGNGTTNGINGVRPALWINL